MRFLVVLTIGLFFSASFSQAKVRGVCSNCHTMHNSQNGTIISGNSTAFLLKLSCFGCHAQGGAQEIYTIGQTRIPQVYHTSPNDLAGGNFAYVDGTKGGNPSDEYGHNVIDLVGKDEINNMNAPGGIKQYYHENGQVLNGELNCAGKNGCHGYRDGETEGIAALKGAHHSGVEGACNGTSLGDSFRFLLGVKGYEDPDWKDESPTKHNEYYGVPVPIKLGCGGAGVYSCHIDGYVKPPTGTISQFCATCHGNFHTLSTEKSEGVGETAESPFLRHPTDLALPDGGEYASYTTYNPKAPVGRTTLYTSPSSVVHPGSDVVICLSCHYAHAGPYPDMLRWDYSACIAGGGNNTECGCFVCHTQKD